MSFLRIVRWGLGVVLFALGVGAGCSSEPGQTCVGGVVDAAGVCQPICDPAKCVAGNICFDNQCVLPCASHDDCQPNTHACAPIEDDTGASIYACKARGHWPSYDANGIPGSFGRTCFFNPAECAGIFACPNGLECDPGACYGDPSQCILDAAACGDVPAEDCNIGTCANHDPNESCNFGVAPPRCSVSQRVCSSDDDCKRCAVMCSDPAQCTPFTCITIGEGDATAYCTHDDCGADDDCPPGYYCGVTRDPHDICGPTCAGGTCMGGPNAGGTCMSDGQCQKGNNTRCGITTEPCIDPSQFAANGATLVEGPACLNRKTCLKRNDCAPCAGNIDCSLGDGDVCSFYGGGGVCARFCTQGTDCRGDEFCQPYAPMTQGATGTCKSTPNVDCVAAADCPEEADRLAADGCIGGRMVCVPASGACDASNAGPNGTFCHHCRNDLDCGDAASGLACDSPTEGEWACFDTTFSSSCTSDSNCPMSPSGDSGECLDEDNGVGSGNAVYQKCYWPFDDVDFRFTCWTG
jgi:hypothetical protein